ncbi:MAG: hypothetical protein ACJA2Q_000218 [Pseudohongiellaceae bacterium]|jgi:hypothetical protein
MLALTAIITCLSLLAVAVFVLHSYQLRAASNSAERATPLTYGTDLDQPLEFNDSLLSIASDDIQIDEFNLHVFRPVAIESIFSASAPNVPIESKPETAAIKIRQSDKDTPHYPLLGAYNQSCIALRQRLKTINANPKLLDTTLRALYRTAAVAELLHSRKSKGKLSLGQLKMLPDELIDGLDMPYNKLGYSELRLLRKCDIKRMLMLWGKPELQQCPRSYHRQNWQEICGRFGW